MVSDNEDLMRQLPHHSRRASQGMGLCVAAALLVAAAPARAAAAGQPSWVPIGPAGGAIAVLAAAPGGIVYAGALWGAGVFRSDDGGRHWRPPGNGLPTLIVTALAVVPGRPEIVYAAVDRSGPARPKLVDAGGDQLGPYLSTDGGGSWLPAADGFAASNEAPLVAAMAATAEGSAVYALTSDGSLYKTRPGRRSWSRIVLPDLAASITADPRRPSTLYAGAATGIYRTRDGGETWSLLGSGSLPAGAAPILTAVDPAAPGSLYALYQTFRSSPRLGLFLFHSPDDGVSWVSHTVPLPSGCSSNSLAVEPGGKVLLAPGCGSATPAPALLETIDGGATWAAPAGAPGDDFIWALLAAPGETATVYAGGPRGFWLSADAGDRWRASSVGLDAQLLISMRIASNGSSSFLYASVEDLFSGEFFLFRRETGGTWKAVGGATSYAVVGVDPERPEIVYASLYDGNLGTFFRLWKSYDGGLTWSALGFPEGEPIDVFKIDPGSPRTLYAGSMQTADPADSSCHLSKSLDGGKTWACLLTTPDTSVLLIDPAHTSNLYLVSSSGQLYASRDGGAAWHPAARGLPPYQPVSVLALDPADSRRLYAAVQVSDQAAAVYGSDDGAGGWTLLAEGLPGPITSLAVDPHQPLTLYAGVISTGCVVRSTDRGLHWHRFDAGLPPGSFIGGFLFDPVQPPIVYTATDAEGVYMLDTGRP